jgi:hypothetical protein
MARFGALGFLRYMASLFRLGLFQELARFQSLDFLQQLARFPFLGLLFGMAILFSKSIDQQPNTN